MGVVAALNRTCADSVAKFTAACVAGRRFSTFSMRTAQAAQVMPSSARSTWSAPAGGAGASAPRRRVVAGEASVSMGGPYTPAGYRVKYPYRGIKRRGSGVGQRRHWRSERLIVGRASARRDASPRGRRRPEGRPTEELGLGQTPSGLSCGNRITSRIDGLSVSSITSRSMPMPSPAVGRQAVLERADVVGVVVHRLLVAGLLRLRLRGEARGLVLGVVQLGEAVGDLAAGDEQLEAVGDRRVRVVARARAARRRSGARR